MSLAIWAHFLCAPSITALELFNCVVEEYESMVKWNDEMKDFLKIERVNETSPITY